MLSQPSRIVLAGHDEVYWSRYVAHVVRALTHTAAMYSCAREGERGPRPHRIRLPHHLLDKNENELASECGS